jgi:NADPH:quinone reductase-like Zn-dependent oxidoreductase
MKYVYSGKNASLVESLGADEVIDYIHTDFTKNGQQYDIIYDTVGKSSFSAAKNSLTANGTYLSPVLGVGLLFQLLKTMVIGDKKAKFAATGTRAIPELRSLLNELVDILSDGQLKMVIDRRYPLKEVAAAHRYVDTGRKKGNPAIIVS